MFAYSSEPSVHRRLATILLAATAICSVSGANAADTTSVQASSNNGGVEEVTVTAERRAESLQKVPMEVNAFDQEQLQSAGVDRTFDLPKLTPGLVFDSASGDAFVFLRGVGTLNAQAGTENGVALYVDDVYNADAAGALTSLDNAQRVEVLKGPQGTLYGRNATGGLIHVITPDPVADPSLTARVGYESYNTAIGSLYATGALADNLNGNISVDVHNQFDGFGKYLNVDGGHREANYLRYFNSRSKLLWTPTAQDRITFEGSYFRDSSDQGYVDAIYPGTVTAFGFTFKGTRFDAQQGVPFKYLNQAYDVSIKWEHDLGNGVVFKSVSAYRDVHSRESGFATEPDPSDFSIADSKKNTWSFQQEFLLQGSSDRLNYTAGLFYFTDASRWPFYDIIGGGLVVDGDRPLTTLGSYSAFAQADYNLTPADTVTVGGRYTLDRQGTNGDVVVSGIDPAALGLAPGEFMDSQHKDYGSPTWRLGYKHQFSDDLMAYVSASRGFRSGEFNPFVLGAEPVKPENLTAYEGGFKDSFFQKHIQLGLNGFYYQYHDLQVQEFQSTPPATFLRNAADAKMYGLELEAVADVPVPVGNLLIRANGSVMHTEFVSFANCGISTIVPTPAGEFVTGYATGNCKGNALPYSPKSTITIGPDYTVPLADIGGQLELSASWYHNSGYFFNEDDVFKQPAYDTVSADISYTFPDGRTRLRLYGRNLTNAVINSVREDPPEAVLLSPAPPRIFGGEFDFTFE